MYASAAIVPLAPGQAEAWRRWTQELGGVRKHEFADACRRLGILRVAAWSTEIEHAEVVILYIERSRPEQTFSLLAASQEPFDLWLKQQLSILHGLDLSQLMRAFRGDLVFAWPNGQQPAPRLQT
jgi:LmbE family N-acetylglucosaminyl deacetylase